MFNYSPTKEDLVFHRMQAFEDELLAAVRERPEGESIVRAFGRFAIQPRGFLDEPCVARDGGTIAGWAI